MTSPIKVLLIAALTLGALRGSNIQIPGTTPSGAALPATCTPGPNGLFVLSTAGPAGRLYVCSATNTWSVSSAAIACLAAPGNTAGAYRQQCQTTAGALYACNVNPTCAVAVDWVAVGGGSSLDVCKIIVNPAPAGETWLFGRATTATTATKVFAIVVGGTSVVVNLQECAVDGTACANMQTASLTATTTGASTTALTNPTVVAGGIMKLVTSTVTGAVTQLMVCVE